MRTRQLASTVLAVALATGVAACGGQSDVTTSSGSDMAPPPPAGSVKLKSATVGGHTILVNAAGRTLYMYAPDAHTRVSCSFDCQSVWPPEIAPSHGRAIATGAVRQSLIGSDRNPIGGRVVTYGGWPLYTFVTDEAPGQETGQALDVNGGYWYVMSVAGQPIR
jgi:predicted lipoprotein with Yx(FWY)xxD motif